MQEITPENGRSWRDIADQLTPEQVAEIAGMEQRPPLLYDATMVRHLSGDRYSVGGCRPRTLEEQRTWLSAAARLRALENLVAAMVGEVPPPDGATHVGAWQDADPLPYRVVFGSDWRIAGHQVTLSTAVIQFADGSIDGGEPPHVAILDGDTETGLTFSAPQARALGAALLAAADEIDGMAK